MAALPVGQYHHTRPLLTDNTGDLEPIFPCVLNAAIGNVQRMAETGSEDSSGFRGLAGAIFGCAAGSHLALGEIENAGAVAAFRHFEQRSSASLFYVVTVCGDGQYVERRVVVFHQEYNRLL